MSGNLSPVVRQYVRHRITDKWINTLAFVKKCRIKDIPETIGITDEQFEDFLGEFRMTASEFRTNLRLEYAMRLFLEGSAKSLQAAARAAGYEDDSNFKRLFRLRFGANPKEAAEFILRRDDRKDPSGISVLFESLSEERKQKQNGNTSALLASIGMTPLLDKKTFPDLHLRIHEVI